MTFARTITVRGIDHDETYDGAPTTIDSPGRRILRKLFLHRPATADRPAECRW